jgi:DNA-binding transcriptional MerR regulator
MSDIPEAGTPAVQPPSVPQPTTVVPPGAEQAPKVPEGHGIYSDAEVKRWREQASGSTKFVESLNSKLKDAGYNSLDDAIKTLQSTKTLRDHGMKIDELGRMFGQPAEQAAPESPDIESLVERKFSDWTSKMTRQSAEDQWGTQYQAEFSKVEKALEKLPESSREMLRDAAMGRIYQTLTPDKRPFQEGHPLSKDYGNPAGIGDELVAWITENAKRLGVTRPAPAATPGGSLETDPSREGGKKPVLSKREDAVMDAVRAVMARKQH